MHMTYSLTSWPGAGPAAWLRAPEFSRKLASLLRKDSIVAGYMCCVKAKEKGHTADGMFSPACR